MVIASKTDSEILKELGGRLRSYRLQVNLTQAELSTRAGVSRTTIRDAELGKDSQLSTLVKFLRALGRLDNLDAFLPAPSVSPIQLMKRQGKPRQRARSGSACLNSCPRFISGLRAGCEWCRVVHGGVRRLRRTQSRGGQLGAHPGFHLTRPAPSVAVLRGTFRSA